MLLTTTNQVVAGPSAAARGVDPLLSTRLQVKGDRYTGRLVEGFCTGPGKARALLAHCEAAGVDPRRCAMFGDGRSDMEALDAVGEPVAVHPMGALAERAAARGGPCSTCRCRAERGVIHAGRPGEPGRGAREEAAP